MNHAAGGGTRAYEQLVQVFRFLSIPRQDVYIRRFRSCVQSLPVAMLATTSNHRAVELLNLGTAYRAMQRTLEIKKADTTLSAKIRNSRHSSPSDTSLAYGSADRERLGWSWHQSA
jgi:hypothetical protein